jgi:ferredoxin
LKHDAARLPARGSQREGALSLDFFTKKGECFMAFVVCEPCRDCKYTDCVAVCPMECFYQDENMLYIDPIDCIDCEACVPECPVEAIFHDTTVPPAWTQFIQLNAERVAVLKANGGHITERQEPKFGSGCRGSR